MNFIAAAAAALTLGPLLMGSAAAIAASGGRKESGVAGLLLHSVDKKPNLSMSSYPKERFKMFLDYLKTNGIETITVSRHRSRTQNITKKIAITFDDGLQSFYDNAYPLLEENGFKSTVFAVAGAIGQSGNWDVYGQSSHISAHALREIAGRGHEIASHSLTHANLVWLDDKELKKELVDSKAILEDITGTAVRSLSFPFGSWNRRVWEAAKLAGYEYGTAYRGHRRAPAELLPVMGAYRFDSAQDIVNRIGLKLVTTEGIDLKTPILSVTEGVILQILIGTYAIDAPLSKEVVEDYAIRNKMDVNKLILSTFPLHQERLFPFEVVDIGGNRSRISFKTVPFSEVQKVLNAIQNLAKI